MGVRFPSAGAPQAGPVTLVTTAETIIATSPPLNISLDFALVILLAYFNVTPGTAAGSMSCRIRRGTGLTGVSIGVSNTPACVAGTTISYSFVYLDTPGAVAAQQYVLTCTANAATGNSTVNEATLLAFML